MAQEKLTMRVILHDGDIRKITVIPRPNTVDDLIALIKTTIGADYQFTLQYNDPEFNNAPCNLNDMSELPEKPTLRIVPFVELVPVQQSDISSETSSQADTEILSTSSNLSNSSMEVRKEWPQPFYIPKFSVSVEYQLRRGNRLYLRDETHLNVTKETKHYILEKLAETIYSYKAYPKDEDFEDVAKALIGEHPCLKERGSSSGYQGWKKSLKFKMSNYRNDMRKLGHLDVTINAGKRGRHNMDGEAPHKNIKKPRKGEVNYLPDFPKGMDSESLESAREAIINEMKKKSPDDTFIKQEMNTTFALRRAEVVKDKADISQMVQRWPALFTESQINMEFNRITGKNLKGEFFSALDGLCSSLEEVFKRKSGRVGQLLADLQKQKKTADPTVHRCYALRGLAVVLGDDASKFFINNTNGADGHCDIPVGLILNSGNGGPEDELNPSKVGILLEGNVVMDSISSLPLAMSLLFGLTYALHLEYPKTLKNTFLFIQNIMLNLGQNNPPRKLKRLKNELSMFA